jgi:hypothetical protein
VEGTGAEDTGAGAGSAGGGGGGTGAAVAWDEVLQVTKKEPQSKKAKNTAAEINFFLILEFSFEVFPQLTPNRSFTFWEQPRFFFKLSLNRAKKQGKP